MREELGRWADAVGARSMVARGRDRLVDLLNGDGSSPGVRRNRIDDRHLKLLLSFLLRPDSNCLDVGANRGLFLYDFQRMAPHGHHIAYEPVPSQWERLVRLFPEADIRRRALSDHEGEMPYVQVLDPGFQGYSRLEAFGGETLPDGVETKTFLIATERLDNHLPDGWLPDFVKIDVEGAELLVLRGAIETLRRSKPVIALEHGWHADVSEEIYKLICDDVGLRLFDMDGHGPLDRLQFLEGVVTRWNWVAHE